MRSSDAQEDGSTRDVEACDQDEVACESACEPDEASALGRDTATRVRDFVYAERWTWVSFLVHSVGLFCVSLLPPQSSALALDMLNDDLQYARYLTTPVERPVLDPFSSGDADAAPDSAKAADGEGQAGKPDVPQRARRRSGGRDQPHMDREIPDSARNAGILGILARTPAPSGVGMFEVQGDGGGELAALGAMLGSTVGDSFGFNGLGMRATGRGGGGDAQGSIGVGELGTVGGGGGGNCPGCVPTLRGPRHDSRVPSLRAGIIETQGSLSKEVIRRVIQRRLNEVRFCYEENLRSLPELAGRVEVKFVISPAGAVQAASIAENTLLGDYARTAQCINEAVKRWSFPAPEGGGVVIVQYPFLLETSQ
jgi:hypothetical protein